MQKAICLSTKCPDAHSKDELETPELYKDMPGYKSSICSYYVIDRLACDVVNCFDAHGEEELRRLEPSVPSALQSCDFSFSDAHVHLDHVLWSRRYGSYWFYKFQRCKRDRCHFAPGTCLWVHKGEKRDERPMYEEDLQGLANDIKKLPGTFDGLVHSCCDADGIEDALRLVEWGGRHLDGKVYVSFGVHPSNFEEYTPEVEQQFLKVMDELGSQCVAWGECGLDYYRRGDDIRFEIALMDKMKSVFARQARIAVERGLPLVVHSREAEHDTMEVIRENVPRDHVVYMHSFMGSLQMLEELLQEFPNGYVGIAGAVTYDEYGGMGGIVERLPLERLLLETDGPYMAPNPYRGEESHPGQIPWIAETIAAIKGVSAAEVLRITHQNFVRVYGLDREKQAPRD